MLWLLRIPAALAALFSLIGAAPAPECPPFAKRQLGFSLNTNPNGNHFTAYLYTVLEGKVVGNQPLKPESFILQATGLLESPANLEAIDLFERYGIAGCSPIEYVVRTGLDCSVLRSLWKLRFHREPIGGNETGWAGEPFAPSARQQVLLQMYRAPDQPHWQGPYVGDNAFRLLRDIQDPQWVRLYRDGG